MPVLPYEEEIRVEGKTVSMLLLVVKKICGLQLMMVCTALPLQKKFDFRVLDKVRTIHTFGFGKAKPGNDYPAIYLMA